MKRVMFIIGMWVGLGLAYVSYLMIPYRVIPDPPVVIFQPVKPPAPYTYVCSDFYEQGRGK